MIRWIVFTLLIGLSANAASAQSAATGVVPHAYLVQWAPAPAGALEPPFAERQKRIEMAFGSRDSVQVRLVSARFRVLEVRTSAACRAAEGRLRGLFDHVQPVHRAVYRSERRPGDARYGEQWDMELIGAPSAWSVTTGGLSANGDTLVLAVIDEGAELSHPDLAPNIWRNWAEVPNDGVDNDQNGYVDDRNGWCVILQNDNHPGTTHGTATAGIVGARGDNGIGVTGVNWAVKLMILSQAFTEADVLEAYDYILTMRQRYNETGGAAGAYVVGTTIQQGFMGDPAVFPLWCSVYDSLGAAGILNVAATVNRPDNVDRVLDIPTSCGSDFLITVTNTDRNDVLRPTAGYGRESIDLGAPGSESITTTAWGGYAEFSGTSAAAPHVGGAVALLYALPEVAFAAFAERQPRAAALLVKDAILEGVRPLPSLAGKSVSGGRLDVGRSMALLRSWWSVEAGANVAFAAVYPNPVAMGRDAFVTLSGAAGDYALTLRNATGQMVWAATATLGGDVPHRLSVPTLGLPAGVYVLTVAQADRVVDVVRVVVQP